MRVFRRDGWLCRWCGRPVIFDPTMKYLERLVRDSGYTGRLAYFNLNWRREAAPLLDHMGAVIDHIEAFSKGGAHEESNFATACSKCNARKTDGEPKEPRRPVRARYGEPTAWDGLSRVFVALAGRPEAALTASEAGWLKALHGVAKPPV